MYILMNCCSGFLTSAVNPHLVAQDDANERMSTTSYFLCIKSSLLSPNYACHTDTSIPVLQRHIIQITSALLPSLRHTLPRSLLGLHQITLQHALQNPLHLLIRLHTLPHDDQIPPNIRSKPRHLPCTIPTHRRGRARHNLSLRIHALRNPLGIQYLA